ncbi:SDR39U1 [Bugula neritina]|uniref:SDR39U1 n=1 Tax=Bugula neritina TaxID=10212 RepID=A0A7J7IV77_BUGNE|nr:SDR39U1 [Bugula neritina]
MYYIASLCALYLHGDWLAVSPTVHCLAMGKDGGMLASMYWPFFFGVGGVIGDGQQWFPWIHVDDVAGIMLHAINNTNVHGVLNAVAPETATNGHFTNALSTSMRRYAPFPVPKCLLSLTLGDQRADMMTSSPKILPSQTLASGYSFKYSSLQAACDDCVKWG